MQYCIWRLFVLVFAVAVEHNFLHDFPPCVLDWYVPGTTLVRFSVVWYGFVVFSFRNMRPRPCDGVAVLDVFWMLVFGYSPFE